MTWAGKLIRKIFSPLDAWEEVPHEDPQDMANTKSLIDVHDLVLAVLEKNEKIQERYKEIKSEIGFIEADIWLQENESLMARQLVQACEKVKRL